MTTSRFPKRWRSRLDPHHADAIAVVLILIDITVLVVLTLLWFQGWLRIDAPVYLS